MSINLPGRGLLDSAIMPNSDHPMNIRVFKIVEPRFFDVCPICGDNPTENEHIPGGTLGGQVMTKTCKPCNNGLGSRVESDLLDWYENAITLPKFTSAALPGERRSARILVRTGAAGECLLFMDGNCDPAVIDMLRSGQVDLRALQPDPNRVRLALLKHVYLSSCLINGIPDKPMADLIRRDLIAARDAKQKRDVPYSDIAMGLTFLKGYDCEPAIAAPVVTAIAELPAGPCPGVLLGGRIFVSWVSELGRRPAPVRQVHISMAVSPPIEGTVASVEHL